jgi:hypothetical protein
MELRLLALNKAPNTCPGPNLICNQMLKKLPHFGMNFLLLMFDQYWRSGQFSFPWCSATIIPF